MIRPPLIEICDPADQPPLLGRQLGGGLDRGARQAQHFGHGIDDMANFDTVLVQNHDALPVRRG